MLKRKALRKILITTFTMFTLFVLYLIPAKVDNNYLGDNVEVIYTSNTVNQEIYLLGENSYLVKFQVFLEEEDVSFKVKKIIDYLRVDSSKKRPIGLSGIIPTDAKLLDVKVQDHRAILNFSKEILDVDERLEERLIEAIVYSVTGLFEIEEVSILIEGNVLEVLPKSNKRIDSILTRDFGINKVYDITNRNGIQKVTIFYLDKISNNNYYVPVTRYVNDSRDKIKIIVDNLASAYIYEENLMSFLNSQTTILDYTTEEDTFILNLNDAVFGNSTMLEEVEYTLGYSIFENYDVDNVLLKVNGEVISELSK